MLYNRSSEKFLLEICSKQFLGDLPLFYLDAHWYDYWPLPDKIRIITAKLENAIIIIDDFEVPDRPDFKFCRGGGGSPKFSGRTTVDERACNLSLIQPNLETSKDYKFLSPSYGVNDSHTTSLIGYISIFQNLDKSFKNFKKERFVRRFFREYLLGMGYSNSWKLT